LLIVLGLMGFLSQSGNGQNVLAWGDNSQGQTNVPPSASNVVAVAAGDQFSMGLRSDGSILSWGNAPAAPAGLTNVLQIAAGVAHCIALKTGGTVVGWGPNSFPVPPTATNVISIAAGYYHVLALRADGTVVAWGQNSASQCNVPVSLSNVVAIAAGAQHSLALQSDGSMVIWGGSSFLFPQLKTAPINPGKDIAAISAGANFNLAVRANGRVLSWGDNTYGQAWPPRGLTNIVQVVGGTNYAIALKADGTATGWSSLLTSATRIPALATNISSLAAGPRHCVAVINAPPLVRRAGAYRTAVSVGNPLPVYALAASANCQWLRDGVPLDLATNAFPQIPAELGFDSSTYSVIVSNQFGVATNSVGSVRVSSVGFWGDNLVGQGNIPASITNPVMVAAGAAHGLALNRDGTVTAWGKNWSGQTNVPAGLTNVVAIAAGSDHSLALKQDGSVIGWGRDWDGQVDIPPSATNVIAIAAGAAHSVALRRDGTVVAWGTNDLEQILIPTSLTNVISIAAGYYHTLALCSDHSLVAWGLYNAVPPSASNVVQIAGGFSHSMALRADGTVVAWGDNTYGQTNVPRSLTNVIAIAAGYYHSVALQADGNLVAWGKNANSVTNVPGLNVFSSVSAGEDFTLACSGSGLPEITRSPANAEIHSGGSAIFSADVRGNQPLSLQWLDNGVPIVAATNNFLLLPAAQSTDAGDYMLIASNFVGQASSSPATLSVSASPAVAGRTAFTNVLIGQPICLAPSITGAQPLSYQWLKNGVPLADDGRINGSTSPMLCLSATIPNDSGDFQLALNNGSGSATGLIAHLSLTSVIGWGDNFSHQLEAPPDSTDVVGLACGDDHVLGLRANGTIVAWGDNTYGQIDVPASATNIVAIAAGGAQSMALTSDGHVLLWGDSRGGIRNIPAFATNIYGISLSSTHAIALRPDGTHASWGAGLGTAFRTSTNTRAAAAGPGYTLVLDGGGISGWGDPARPNDFPSVGWQAMAAGPIARVGLATNGGVRICGPPFDSLGGTSGSSGPPGATNIAAVAVGLNHVAFLRSEGWPLVWWNNDYGQTNVPAAATNLTAIACGPNDVLGLLPTARPLLEHQASSRTIQLGDPMMLVAATIGNAPATYQWQQNGVNVPGATNAFLTFSTIRWTNSGTYRAIVSDPFGSVTGPSTTLSITPTTLQFDPAGSSLQATNGTFQMRLLGASGVGSVLVYASTNLVTWSAVLTNAPFKGAAILSVPVSPDEPQCFYRAAEVY
jgi:alpha-tubulin suppressor-like RCC1 family protein